MHKIFFCYISIYLKWKFFSFGLGPSIVKLSDVFFVSICMNLFTSNFYIFLEIESCCLLYQLGDIIKNKIFLIASYVLRHLLYMQWYLYFAIYHQLYFFTCQLLALCSILWPQTLFFEKMKVESWVNHAL